MTPTKFTAANQMISGANGIQMEIRAEGDYCLSCWKLTLIERLSALVFGRVWVCVRAGIHPELLVAAQRKILE